MPDTTHVPDATAYRLSLYHCLLGELLQQNPDARVTSGSIAARLEIKEEIVRRDVSFVGTVGRPGSGYEAASLFNATRITHVRMPCDIKSLACRCTPRPREGG